MKMNKVMLTVLDELKNNTYFFLPNNFIEYKIPNKEESIEDIICIRKIAALRDLSELGAIKIHNDGEERVPGTNAYEFNVLIIQPAFNGIYKRCVREVKNLTVEEYKKQIALKKNMPALLKKYNEITKSIQLGKKQRKLLQLLGRFDPISLTDLEKSIPTKDIKDLKRRVNIKLAGSGLSITTIRSKNISHRGKYQLTHFPPKNH